MKLLAIVSAGQTNVVVKSIRARKHKSWLIGEVVKGRGKTSIL